MRHRTTFFILGLLMSGRHAAAQVGVAEGSAPWPSIASRLLIHARLDSTRVIPIGWPASGSTVYTDAIGLRFTSGVSLTEKRATLDRQRLTVVAVSPDSTFFVRIPAPATIEELSAKVESIARDPSVASAGMVHRRPTREPWPTGYDRRVAMPEVPGLPLLPPPPRIIVLPRRKILDD